MAKVQLTSTDFTKCKFNHNDKIIHARLVYSGKYVEYFYDVEPERRFKVQTSSFLKNSKAIKPTVEETPEDLNDISCDW